LILGFEPDERTESPSDLEYINDRVFLATEYMFSKNYIDRLFATQISFQMLRSMVELSESAAAGEVETLIAILWRWLEFRRRSGGRHGSACPSLWAVAGILP